MADNFPITPGSGATIATDDVSGVQFQKIKLDVGEDGASVPAPGDATYGLGVDVKRVTGSVTVDSELPAAAALADAVTPTAPTVGSALLGYNGTTWDRLRSSIDFGLKVDVARITGEVPVVSELSDAAVLADAETNPTTTTVGSDSKLFNGTTWDRARSATAIASDGVTGLGSGSVAPLRYNGSTYDRERNNSTAVLLNVVGSSAVQTSPNQVNYNAKGVQLFLRVDTAPGGQTLTAQVQAVDPEGLTQVAEIVTFPATGVAAANYLYTIYPGVSETVAQANHELQSLPVPRHWRVIVTPSGGSWSYTLSASYLP